MQTKKKTFCSEMSIGNTHTNYSKFDNFLVTLVIWQLLPLGLADWIINYRRNRHD